MGRSDRSLSSSPDPWDKKKKKKKKKKHKKSSSESEESDSGKAESYEAEIAKLKDEARRQKDTMKSSESVEEKHQRRLAKREEKAHRKKLASGVSELGYTNTTNPFGDEHLTEAFTWKKKPGSSGAKDSDTYEARKRTKEKQEELRIELEKVKKRKQEREDEKVARDEENSLIQREKEAAMFSEWGKQEDEFHLHQARLRSSIRIRDERAKPIDLLAAYINPDEDDLEIQMHEPYAALVGLSIDDMEDLLEDITVYVRIDHKKNLQFWEDIRIVVEDETEKLRKKRQEDEQSNRREVINSAVQTDVHSIFKGKTYSQLVAIQSQITQKIRAGGSIDIGYWEALLQQLKAFMAKARLRERHQNFLKNKLSELKMESSVEDDSKDQKTKSDIQCDDNDDDAEPDMEVSKETSKEVEVDSETAETSSIGDEFKIPTAPVINDTEAEKEGEVAALDADATFEKEEVSTEQVGMEEKAELQRISEEDSRRKAYDLYEEGSFSPKHIPFGDIEEENWIDHTEDLLKLEYLREQVKMGSTVEEEEEAENLFNTDMIRDDENAEAFNTPVQITQKKYLWTDKYRPRKPRFFNRVHTGYEWNKYNQTHYDTDNPPPKIVQGYKFNIFYPDLIDKTHTPEYTLTPCEGDADFAHLRFVAGPPYEDIAFKVVNREWEQAHRHGFKCQFYNNIFQLYFHFKRYRYRR